MRFLDANAAASSGERTAPAVLVTAFCGHELSRTPLLQSHGIGSDGS